MVNSWQYGLVYAMREREPIHYYRAQLKLRAGRAGTGSCGVKVPKSRSSPFGKPRSAFSGQAADRRERFVVQDSPENNMYPGCVTHLFWE